MIRPLDSDIVSKLRSGVAVATYAQCVEELVLNSLDAGSTCVAVRVDLMYNKIQVVDNGNGIDPNEMHLVGERYSTSKCHEITDLDNLRYYGYRGEALASIRDIAAILEIQSKTKQTGNMYYKIFRNGNLLESGKSKQRRPSVGTTVTALDMFYNLPVRRKGMNASLEMEKIRHRIECIALIHPNASLSLRDDTSGTKLLQTHKSSTVIGAFTHLFGSSKARHLKKVESRNGQFQLQGYISKEGHSNRNLQFIYINERLLLKTKLHKFVNYLLSKSMIVRKRSRLDERQKGTPDYTVATSSPSRQVDRYGIFVLNVTCSLREYDITLDPAKTLVEFKNWDGILACIQQGVQGFLERENLLMGLEKPKSENESGKLNLDGLSADGEIVLVPPGSAEDREKSDKQGGEEANAKGLDLDATSGGAGAKKCGSSICAFNTTNNLVSKTVKRKLPLTVSLNEKVEGSPKEINEAESLHSCGSSQGRNVHSMEKTSPLQITPEKSGTSSQHGLENPTFCGLSPESGSEGKTSEDSEELPTIKRPRKKTQKHSSDTECCLSLIKGDSFNQFLTPSSMSNNHGEGKMKDDIGTESQGQNDVDSSSGLSLSSEEITPGQGTPRVTHSKLKCLTPVVKPAECSGPDSTCSREPISEGKSECDECKRDPCVCISGQPFCDKEKKHGDIKNLTIGCEQPSGLTPLKKLRQKISARDNNSTKSSIFYRSCVPGTEPFSQEKDVTASASNQNANSFNSSDHFQKRKSIDNSEESCAENTNHDLPKKIMTLTDLRTLNKMKNSNQYSRPDKLVELKPLKKIREKLSSFKRTEGVQKTKAEDMYSTPQELIRKDSSIPPPCTPKLGCASNLHHWSSSHDCSASKRENETCHPVRHSTPLTIATEKDSFGIPSISIIPQECDENKKNDMQEHYDGCQSDIRNCNDSYLYHSSIDVRGKQGVSLVNSLNLMTADATVDRSCLKNVSLVKEPFVDTFQNYAFPSKENYKPENDLTSVPPCTKSYPACDLASYCQSFYRDRFAPLCLESSVQQAVKIMSSDDLLHSLRNRNDILQYGNDHGGIKKHSQQIDSQHVTLSSGDLPFESYCKDESLYPLSTSQMDTMKNCNLHNTTRGMDNNENNSTLLSIATKWPSTDTCSFATAEPSSSDKTDNLTHSNLSTKLKSRYRSSGENTYTIPTALAAFEGLSEICESQEFSLTGQAVTDYLGKGMDVDLATTESSTQPFKLSDISSGSVGDSGFISTSFSHDYKAESLSRSLDDFLPPPTIARFQLFAIPRSDRKHCDQDMHKVDEDKTNITCEITRLCEGKGRRHSAENLHMFSLPPKIARLTELNYQRGNADKKSKMNYQSSVGLIDVMDNSDPENWSHQDCESLTTQVEPTDSWITGDGCPGDKKSRQQSGQVSVNHGGQMTIGQCDERKRGEIYAGQEGVVDRDQCAKDDASAGRSESDSKVGKAETQKASSVPQTNTVHCGFGLLSQQWICRIDPKSGRTMYVNSVNGNTTFDKPMTDLPQEQNGDKTAFTLVKHHKLLTDNADAFLPAVQRREKTTTAPSLSPVSQASLSALWIQHQDLQEEESTVKWRDADCKRNCDSLSGEVQSLLDKWENPVLKSSDQSIPNLNVFGTQSAGIYPFKFTKDMFNRIEVVQQIDNKFIACMVSLNQECSVPNLLVVIDQHAAHERVRLEDLVKENYVDSDQQRILTSCIDPPEVLTLLPDQVRLMQAYRTQLENIENYVDSDQQRILTSCIDPPEVLTLLPDQVRLMQAYRTQLENIGIHFQCIESTKDKVQFSKVPACFVSKEVSELKRKRTSVLVDLLESLVTEQLQLLQSTSGGSRRLPRVIHQVLCSQACHGAIKFGDPLTLEECNQVVQQLSKCDLPFQCAHGRPSIMPLLDMDLLDRKLACQIKSRKPCLHRLWQRMLQENISSEEIESENNGIKHS
ncbi:uncharacterized protein LOC106159817 [Lingula anatina]|uniref:Uncharacterized protein LOC106159817 n=1 Tax=Lingula anatina TaxID=7574 RepID=A0A1S3I087_LINAN|nr:uncharacterized protein LOC106159817 [Lingula anatina]|eukprot:XP_013391673.1 uncharacterized protein LOC106159817 [Lingula anatina]